MYKAVSNGIRVTVVPRYLEEESRPQEGGISSPIRSRGTNLATEASASRLRWKSLMAHYRTDWGGFSEVRGDRGGGSSPELGPGEELQLYSGAPLDSRDWEGYQGTYEMTARSRRGLCSCAEIPGLYFRLICRRARYFA